MEIDKVPTEEEKVRLREAFRNLFEAYDENAPVQSIISEADVSFEVQFKDGKKVLARIVLGPEGAEFKFLEGPKPHFFLPEMRLSHLETPQGAESPLGRNIEETHGVVQRRMWAELSFVVKKMTLDMQNKQIRAEEIRPLYHSEHPNILPVVQAFVTKEAGGKLYLTIITPYMDGGSLEDLLSKESPSPSALSGIPEKMVKYIAQQVFRGLVELASTKIFHRDIKPENIVFNKQGMVKIADFGVATRASCNSILQTEVGTRLYHSPERFRGNCYQSPSEVWAAGLVIAALLLGQYPLKALTLDGRLRAKSEDENFAGRHVVEELRKAGVQEEAREFVWGCLR